ncbi:hypothetical protein BHM03_00020269 [Ensete ventricosum]|nr:hypothetical protein BHM03_00020269 [Ensete ventricosum]
MSPWEVVQARVEFRSVLRASSRKFEILAIPDVLAHGTSYKFKILAIPDVLVHEKSYEHGFTKKHDGYKLYAKSSVESSFDRFSTIVSEI